MDIEGRIAVVTGAASGIGRAVVEDLVSHKAACVVAVDLSPAVIDVAGDLEGKNHGAEFTIRLGRIAAGASKARTTARPACSRSPATSPTANFAGTCSIA